MTASYKQLALHDVCAGMILSDDLRDDNGVILLSHGVVVTAAILVALKRHRVESVPVLCGEVPAAEEEAEMALRRQHLARLFRKQSGNDASGLLHQFIENFRLGTQS
jgi:hypothetical protein